MTTIAVKPIERLMVVVDIRAWLLHPDPCKFSQLLQHCVRRLLSSCSPSCRWAFKLFDSSLSPFSSRSKVAKLLGSWACSSRFDSVLPGGDSCAIPEVLAQFCSALNCLHPELLKAPGSAANDVANSNASFVAVSLKELLSDYVWDPLLPSPSCPSREEDATGSPNDLPGAPVHLNSNLVAFVSPTQNALAEFLGLSLPAASKADVIATFSSTFRKVRESLSARNIHLCWIDVPLTISTVDHSRAITRSCEVSHTPALRLSVEQLGWTFTSLDALLLGFRLVPFSVLWQGLAYPLFQLLNRPALGSCKLCIQVRDVSNNLVNKTLCKVEAICFGKHFQRLPQGSLLRVRSTMPREYYRCSKQLLSEQALLHHECSKAPAVGNSKVGQENLLENELDRNFVGDYILKRLQQQKYAFQPGNPAWQLLLLHLAREERLAIVELCGSGDSRFALLEPLTIHVAVFSIVDRAFVAQFLYSGCGSSKNESLNPHQTGNSTLSSSTSQIRRNFISQAAVVETACQAGKTSVTHQQSEEGKDILKIPSKRKPLVPLDFASQGSRLQDQSTDVSSKKPPKPSHAAKLDEEIALYSVWSDVLCKGHAQSAVCDSSATLEELYVRSKKRSKTMKAMSCWMRQTDLASSWISSSSTELIPSAGDDLPHKTSAYGLGRSSDPQGAEKMPFPISNPLDESCPIHTELSLDEANVYIASLDQKIGYCLSAPEVDLYSFAGRVVADARTALFIVLRECQSQEPERSKALSFEESIVENLIQILLQKPKKLALKYKKCRPPNSTSQTSESELDPSMYSSEEKVREYELQIHFRMEILSLDLGVPKQNPVIENLVNEVCRLLESIQFNLPGGVFEGESVLDFSNRVLKLRYNERLPKIVGDIYMAMEFNGHDDSSEVDKELDVSKGTGDLILLEKKSGSNTHESSGSGEDNFSHSDNPLSSSHGERQLSDYSRDLSLQSAPLRGGTKSLDMDAANQRLREAKEKRERAKRFSHFASTSKGFIQVTVVPKTSACMKRHSKPQIRTTKAKSEYATDKEVILQTPFPSKKSKSMKSTTKSKLGQGSENGITVQTPFVSVKSECEKSSLAVQKKLLV